MGSGLNITSSLDCCLITTNGLKSSFYKCLFFFLLIVSGDKVVGKLGKPLHYKGSTFHRIILNFMIQGGNITFGDGRGEDRSMDRSLLTRTLR